MIAFSNIESRIKELEAKKKTLGIFKNKEKKALQEQINSLENECSSAKAAKDKAVAPMESEIEKLQKRLDEINDELTKNR
ncbi:MAG: hypothetical protein LIP01_06425 [Tannerellaceae bacterium]|nr:hypothetical protein [Tannerellaceae bacterium]